MRYAVVSDLHANLQAWRSVLTDLESEGADVIVCLGDVVGYGPMPGAVLSEVREHAAAVVLGNHDAAACGRLDASIFNDHARSVIEWTRDQLDEEALDYLNEVPLAVEDEGVLFVHAEVIEPGRFEYLVDEAEAKKNLEACEQRVVFVGHTHHPGVFAIDEKSGAMEERSDADFQVEEGRRYLVNVGSVGEPRNPDDIRARYVIYDSETEEVCFRRVEFDTDAYRADLEREGLAIRPYFLQVLDFEAGVRTQPVIPESQALRRVPVAPVARLSAQPRRLTLPVRPGDGVPKPERKRVPGSELANARSRARLAQEREAMKVASKPSFWASERTWRIMAVVLLVAMAPVAWKLYERSQTTASTEANREERERARAVAPPADDPADGSVLAAAVLEEIGGRPVAPREPVKAKPPPPKAKPVGDARFKEGLLAYWPGDKDMTSRRGSVKVPSGVVAGSVKATRGLIGTAYAFNQGSSLSFGEPETFPLENSSLTVAVWIQMHKPNNQLRHIVGTGHPRDDAAAKGWSLFATRTAIGLRAGNGETAVKFQAPAPSGAGGWRHVAVVIDLARGEAKLFNNGIRVGTHDLSSLGGRVSPARPLTLGRDRAKPAQNNFWGKMDDLAIWGRPLSSVEVKALFDRGKKKHHLGKVIDG